MRCWSWWNEIEVLWFLLDNGLWWDDGLEFIGKLAAKLLVWFLALWHHKSQAFLVESFSCHHFIEVLSFKLGNLIFFKQLNLLFLIDKGHLLFGIFQYVLFF